jgi:hypothetical protein
VGNSNDKCASAFRARIGGLLSLCEDIGHAVFVGLAEHSSGRYRLS